MVRPSSVFLSLPAILALVEAAPLPQQSIQRGREEHKTKRAFPAFSGNNADTEHAFPVFSSGAHKDSQPSNVVTGEASHSHEDAAVDQAPVDPQPKEEATAQANTSPVVVKPFTFSPSAPSVKTSEDESSSSSAAPDSPEKGKKKSKWWMRIHTVGAILAGIVVASTLTRAYRQWAPERAGE